MPTNLMSACPYKGLQPYTEADRDYFFGREREAKIIASNLIAAPLTILYGASGVGKSSVLLAGAVPQLKEKPDLTVVVFRTWQIDAFVSVLKSQVLATAHARINDDANSKAIDIDLNLAFDDFILEVTKALGGRLLFILDQFEEYFLNPPTNPVVDAFDAEFARAVNRQEIDAHFLLSMREDEISRLDRLQGRIPGLLNNTLRVQYLGRQAASDAIRKPLDVFNLKFGLAEDDKVGIEDGLVEALLEKAKPGAIKPEQTEQPGYPTDIRISTNAIETPVLQILLSRLWREEAKHSSRVLRLETFNEQLGGAEKIVATYLSEILGRLNESERDLAVKIFQFLVTPSGTKIAQEPKALAVWAQPEDDQAEERVKSLLKRLSSYEPESQEDLRIMRKVTIAGQPERYEVFHDVLARAIAEWRAEYIQALEHAEAEKQLMQQRQRVKRLAWLLFLLSLILTGIIALAIYAWRQTTRARDAQREASAQRDQANQMLAVVNEVDRTVPFFRAIMRGHNGPLESAVLSQDDRFVVTASQDMTARIWDAYTGQTLIELSGHTSPVTSAVFSHNGKFVATTSLDNSARIWDAGTGTTLINVNNPNGISKVSFSPNDHLIAIASLEGTVAIWDADTGEPELELRGHTGALSSVAFIEINNTTRLLTASLDFTARIWNLDINQNSIELRGHTGPLTSAAFSHNGRLVVTSSHDNTARIWDASTGQKIVELRGHTGQVNSAVFSPDDKLVVTASDDGTARLWDVKTGKSTVLSGHADAVNSAIFSADGEWVITASQDKTLGVWQAIAGRSAIALGKNLVVLRGHTAPVVSVNFSNNGKFIVTASRDKTARIWDLTEVSSLRVSEAVLRADPSNYVGACPVTIKLSGRITVTGGGGIVKYQFVRNNGEETPEQTLKFDSPGSIDVSTTWVTKSPTPPASPVWWAIEILEPKPSESNRAYIKVECEIASDDTTKVSPSSVNIKIKNFGKMDERFYRGAQPKAEDFADLAALGIKTVIDLRDSPVSYERSAVEANGMRYVNIPMNATAYPREEQIQQFLKISSDPDTGEFFVHCVGGRHLTGVAGAVYRMTYYGWDYDRTYKEMKDFDFYTRWGHGPLKDYVQDYWKSVEQGKIRISPK